MSQMFVSFRYKLESAVKLVEWMKPSEKIEAVEFWNALSEDLQDMVNKSADYLKSVAAKKSDQPPASVEESKFSDYYLLSAVIDVPQDGEGPTVRYFDDPTLSTEKVDTVVSDMIIKNGEDEKPDDMHEVSLPVPAIEETLVDEYIDAVEVKSETSDVGSSPNSPQNPELTPVSELPINESVEKPSQVQKKGPREFTSLYRRNKKEYACDMCDKKFRTPPTLYSHRAMHIGQYACKVCQKWCSSNGALSSHMRTHTGEKLFQCEVCYKWFATRRGLLAHMVSHTNDGPYECEKCGKRFAQKYVLQDHLNIHYNNKTYSCDMCEEGFVRRAHLTVHRRRIHGKWNDNQQIYHCDQCDDFFFSQKQLDNHSRVHIDGKIFKPYTCEVCKTSFIRQKTLDEHLNVHKGLKPFECTNCSETFPTSNSLRRHKTLLHKSEDLESDELPKKRRRKKRKGQALAEQDNQEGDALIPDEISDAISSSTHQIFALVMDPEIAELQMGNQALLYNPETQETIPAGENMESVLKAINSVTNLTVETTIS